MAVITLDLIEVADEWQELLESDDESDEGEIEKYHDLCGELGLTPPKPATLRWYAEKNSYPTFIREDTFTDYAQEFAEDIWGEAARELSTYINWEGFADAMRADYYSVEYDGETWLRRA